MSGAPGNEEPALPVPSERSAEQMTLGLPVLLAPMPLIKKALSDFKEFKDAVIMQDPRNYQKVKRRYAVLNM